MLVLEMPEPDTAHLEAILPALYRAISQENGQDPRFVPSLTPEEVNDVRRLWRGGSMRQLRQIVEVVLGVRERFAIKH
jgi:hypothetical protein